MLNRKNLNTASVISRLLIIYNFYNLVENNPKVEVLKLGFFFFKILFSAI